MMRWGGPLLDLNFTTIFKQEPMKMAFQKQVFARNTSFEVFRIPFL